MLCKIGTLGNFAKFTGKHLCQNIIRLLDSSTSIFLWFLRKFWAHIFFLFYRTPPVDCFSHRANISSWNICGTFPWHITGIFGKSPLWNSKKNPPNNVPRILNIGIFPECSMNILRMLHAFFRWTKKYNSSFP